MENNFNVGFVLWLGPTMAAKVNSENSYSRSGNPAIFTEFSTAAFRMGHSQLRSFIRYVDVTQAAGQAVYSFYSYTAHLWRLKFDQTVRKKRTGQ